MENCIFYLEETSLKFLVYALEDNVGQLRSWVMKMKDSNDCADTKSPKKENILYSINSSVLKEDECGIHCDNCPGTLQIIIFKFFFVHLSFFNLPNTSIKCLAFLYKLLVNNYNNLSKFDCFNKHVSRFLATCPHNKRYKCTSLGCLHLNNSCSKMNLHGTVNK